MGEFNRAARQIAEAVGGIENIEAATHCVTRLRFALIDETKVNQKMLDAIDIVKGSFAVNGQFQVVIGQGTVNKVYAELVKETGMGEASKDDVKKAAAQNMNPLQRAVKTLADIFIPILPAIVTAGLLMGLNNILTAEGIFYSAKSIVQVYPQWADLANMINLIAGTAFAFLPALIGWSAVKRFGGSPLLGIVLGLMLVHPDLLNAWGYGAAEQSGDIPVWNLFGLEVQKVGYQGQVLPILLASYLLARLELFLTKRTPEGIQLLVVAPVTLLVIGFLSFVIIGPITFAIGNALTAGLIAVFGQFSAIGGLLYGGLYSALVITGMHHTFLAVDLQLIGSKLGGTFLWPMLALSNIAQGSAALAMMLITKDKKQRGLSLTAGISAYLGITEPAIFGVNLRYKFPFVIAMISSGIAGMFISVKGVLASSVGVGGVPGIFSIMSQYWGPFAIGMLIVLILPFAGTYGYARLKRQK
ncbi:MULTISPECIES: PTS system trehalose-specific EIIBC component [Bacillus amyloliquefaciens group]|jgi:PTS system trehalose-specific IIC component|uniref:PTS system trehalose-specific EIIBC component n=1 Tax=Bacillus amyloliquefaciens group TaxID=1938374 RepID=UPI000B4D2B27|nr:MULTISPECIES: PTS system trehalose-specific EIIBC component [Bacillus amyloliquefaciens group]AVM09469.1 PTS trehalose transporter subunit IIBC [Bacillus velezensis]NUI23572.1 PTS system trehalose-specific EIIBC component [Bacillus amyloliquefaciens]NUI32559.1 PTS system trehalose-specific EIIBC component [Bacillus amyloliquefaciens]NUI36265.1 PTS system trehalose-specific EIIBC component [Bacillus amyloliquefaciens]NUI69933.1 PTS system trehalose-specific EIIBC component [Bacillus amyloliq